MLVELKGEAEIHESITDKLQALVPVPAGAWLRPEDVGPSASMNGRKTWVEIVCTDSDDG